MTPMLLATVVHMALLANDADSYTEAHRVTVETGKPMVVMVSTDWCAPCQTMKKAIIPKVREHGLLRKVAFAIVNPDRDGELANQLTGGGPIPQLVMFRKTATGWLREKLVGGQSVEQVEEFITEGLAHDKAAKKNHGKDPSEESGDRQTPPSAEHESNDAAVLEDNDSSQHG
ncbi:MAG: thioredoxin family protein [Planctomycetaceae bacterium]|nr:thioredoxin family protein [Planctomycetaceae bacterium]